jgi:hypothetical protein
MTDKMLTNASGRNSKKRLMLSLTAGVMGGNLPPFVTGIANQRRYFKKSIQKVALTWGAKESTWMTHTIFTDKFNIINKMM